MGQGAYRYRGTFIVHVIVRLLVVVVVWIFTPSTARQYYWLAIRAQGNQHFHYVKRSDDTKYYSMKIVKICVEFFKLYVYKEVRLLGVCGDVVVCESGGVRWWGVGVCVPVCVKL